MLRLSTVPNYVGIGSIFIYKIGMIKQIDFDKKCNRIY